jgi:microcystin degradation protein MlrC
VAHVPIDPRRRQTIDFLAPMRAVFPPHAQGGQHSARGLDVHGASVERRPALGWSTVAVTDNDLAGAGQIADELATCAGSAGTSSRPSSDREQRRSRPRESARIRRKLGCVTMADASDVVTAGAPGDSAHLLRACSPRRRAC